MFKKTVKEYFTFTNAERRGIIVLLAFILLSLAVRFVLPVMVKSPAHQKTNTETEVREWLDAMAVNSTMPDGKGRGSKTEAIHFVLHDFNPNVVSSDDIESLGVNSTARRAWINYRSKGGKFYRKEDLKKIYGLDSITYHRLEPYIIIEKESDQHSGRNIHANRNDLLLELNNATAAQLKSLKGIGEIFAQRILKYRNLLGGFNSIRQLTEVYGITDSIVGLNENMLAADKSMIEKININKADFMTLSRHPYITEYEAKTIIHYRKTKGDITSFNEMIKNNLIHDSVLTKLTDYLTFR
ncbi:MAG: helix-hairpin-helix domain-containing protein [Bacteroidales bacterium]|nr:helix-hairpin-helix domain-containing protein [Bacteroidales bacterium]